MIDSTVKEIGGAGRVGVEGLYNMMRDIDSVTSKMNVADLEDGALAVHITKVVAKRIPHYKVEHIKVLVDLIFLKR